MHLTRPVHAAADLAGHNAFGDLPNWDLGDLYPAPDAPELARDMAWLEAACAGFEADYRGKLAALDGAGMADLRFVPPPPG